MAKSVKLSDVVQPQFSLAELADVTRKRVADLAFPDVRMQVYHCRSTQPCHKTKICPRCWRWIRRPVVESLLQHIGNLTVVTWASWKMHHALRAVTEEQLKILGPMLRKYQNYAISTLFYPVSEITSVVEIRFVFPSQAGWLADDWLDAGWDFWQPADTTADRRRFSKYLLEFPDRLLSCPADLACKVLTATRGLRQWRAANFTEGGHDVTDLSDSGTEELARGGHFSAGPLRSNHQYA